MSVVTEPTADKKPASRRRVLDYFRPQSRVAAEDRVPFGQKLAYGAGSPMELLCNYYTKSQVTPVFNIGLGLNPALIGLVLVIWRLWDAFTDPFMGHISDNARTRWGRRRPFMVLGAIATGIVLPVLWWAPKGAPEWVVFAWLLGFGILLYTCSTIWTVPYHSLGMELSPDYNERTSIAGYKQFFNTLMGLAGSWLMFLATWNAIAPVDPATGKVNPVDGMRVVGIGMGVVILLLGLMPPLFTRERFYQGHASKQRKTPLVAGLRQTLSNRPFLILIGMLFVKTLGIGMVSTLGFYLNAYYVCGGDVGKAGMVEGVKGTALMAPSLLAVPFFTWLSSRIGKINLVYVVYGMTSLGLAMMPLCYTPNFPYLQIVPHLLLSPLIVGQWMAVPAMIADVTDYDELLTGERREGSFSAVFSWSVKVTMSITSGLAGVVLVWTGFDVKIGPKQPDEVLRTMLWVYTLVPLLFVVLGVLLLSRYPLTRQRMSEIRAALEARRGVI